MRLIGGRIGAPSAGSRSANSFTAAGQGRLASLAASVRTLGFTRAIARTSTFAPVAQDGGGHMTSKLPCLARLRGQLASNRCRKSLTCKAPAQPIPGPCEVRRAGLRA